MNKKQKLNKLELALLKYKNREISTGKAAEIASVSLSRFLDILRERTIPFNYGIKELMEDFKGFLSKRSIKATLNAKFK